MKCVKTSMEDFLRKVGGTIARHPCIFTLCPLMLSFVLTTGIQKANLLQDIESMYVPTTSASMSDRRYLESLFPTNVSSNFYPERSTREGSFGSAIVTAIDGDSVLRPGIFKEVLLLNRAVKSITVYWDNLQWNYKDLCAKRRNVCFQNSIFTMNSAFSSSDDYRRNKDSKYRFDPSSYDADYSVFGRMVSYEKIQEKELRLFYYLDDSTESRKHLAYLWENSFINDLKSLKFSNISVEMLSSRSLEFVSWLAYRTIILYAAIVLCSLALLWLIVATKSNSSQTKPWMGVVIASSSGLAVTSGHGLLMYCDVYYVPSTVIAIFLILAITTVDTLAMVSAWRRTDAKKPIEYRLGETYSETGVSILTSFLVNFISLLLGAAFSPFQEFTIFCYYMSSCLAVGFLHQLTLIGGSIASFGYAEKRNLHSLTFCPLQATATKENRRSSWFRSSWQKEEKVPSQRSRRSESTKNVVYESVIKATNHAWAKSFVIILYLSYFAISIWGITSIENDYSFKDLTAQDTYVNSYFQKLQDFGQYRSKIQVVLNTTLNYADPIIQDKINTMFATFETPEYGEFRTKSWLKEYLKFLSNKKISFLLNNYNMTDKRDFLHVLRHHFLRYSPRAEFVNDVSFNEGDSDIKASRFFLQSYSPMSGREYWNRVQQMKWFSNKRFFPAIVFHPTMFIYEGTVLSMPTMLIQLGVKATATAIIGSVILSDIIRALIICCSYLSVCLGVLGYLALWDVGMNPVSSKCIVCFSSLSINYLTHSTTSRRNIDNNISLVIGSAISTLPLTAVFIYPSWTLPTVFKSLFLASAFSGLHAICFQPAVTSLYDSINDKLVKLLCTESCSRKRDCRIPGKFRLPVGGGIYNGSVVISHIDLSRC